MEIKTKLKEVVDWLTKEYTGIRTGQANPALLDSIKVESYGSYLPIQQVGSVGIEDVKTLRIVPWDNSQVVAVEKAIREADLGLSVVTDSAGLRVIFPELTGERRQQLVKLAKSKLEEARITVRSVRDEGMKKNDRAFKDKEISEDEKNTQKDKIQQAVDETNAELERVFVGKERELQK